MPKRTSDFREHLLADLATRRRLLTTSTPLSRIPNKWHVSDFGMLRKRAG
jgi:hypothetical protein